MSELMKQHGSFSWNELMTPDVEGAKKFYGELLGWELEDMKSGDMDYTIAKTAGRESAGIMKTPADAGNMPPMWGSYVTVENVDRMAQQATELGGKLLVEPADIPKVGRFCVIQDPQGAILSLITYSEECISNAN